MNSKQRENNRKEAVKILTDRLLIFTVHNKGAHIKVYGGRTVDFWPGTGLWMCGRTRGYGIDNLLRYVEGP